MILQPDEIPLIIREGNAGLTSGCFDLLHFHHLHYLERCRAECGFLVVGVDSDSLLRQNKGKDPVIPEYHRAAMVAALRCVDAVFILRTVDQFSDLVRGNLFGKVFKNAPLIYGQAIAGLDLHDPRLAIIPDVHDTNSTTGIVEKIQGWKLEPVKTAPALALPPITGIKPNLPENVRSRIRAMNTGDGIFFEAYGLDNLTILRARIKQVLRDERGVGKRFSTTTLVRNDAGGRMKVERLPAR